MSQLRAADACEADAGWVGQAFAVTKIKTTVARTRTTVAPASAQVVHFREAA